MQGHIDVERFAVAHTAHADVGNAVHGQGVVQQVFAAGRASELIAGGLAQQAAGGHGHAEGLHQDGVSIFQADMRQLSTQHVVVEVHPADDLFAAQDFDVPVAALFREDAPGPVEVGHDGILRAARITSRIGHVSGHIDGHGLGALQVHIDIDVLREDRGQLCPHRAGKCGLRQPGHLYRPHFRQKDVALLVHKEHVVVAARAPDAHGDSVAGQNDIIVVHAAAVGGGEVAPEQIRAERFQTLRHVRAIVFQRPSGQTRHGTALALLQLPGGFLSVHGLLKDGFPLIAAGQIGRGPGRGRTLNASASTGAGVAGFAEAAAVGRTVLARLFRRVSRNRQREKQNEKEPLYRGDSGSIILPGGVWGGVPPFQQSCVHHPS